jgi:hypothetical protein
VVGVCVLAVAGAVTAVLASGGGGDAAPATTGSDAAITVSRQKLYTLGGALATDVDAGVQTNLSTMLTQLPGRHHYGVTISNTSNLGYIDSFQWYPPMGVHVSRVVGSSGGRCGLTGLSGFGGSQFSTVLLYPNIVCTKVALRPPSCTCQGDGGSVTISLFTDRAMNASGVARMISATLVLHPIPSYLQPATTPSQTSTSQG